VILSASMETKLLIGIVQSGGPASSNVKPLLHLVTRISHIRGHNLPVMKMRLCSAS